MKKLNQGHKIPDLQIDIKSNVILIKDIEIDIKQLENNYDIQLRKWQI
jgi:hypothetical protein